jgi:long-chain acyl-CoA synthetase
MNVFAEIRRNASRHGDAVAVVDGAERLTYRALLAEVDQISAELRSLGLQTPQPVALVCQDSVEYILLSLALLSIDAAVVPIPTDPQGEIDRVLEQIDPGFVLYESGAAPFGEGTRLASLRHRKREIRLHARPSARIRPPGYDELGAAFIRFSSGTTSESKGIVLSHRAILERTEAANAGLRIATEDRVLWVLSMSFHFVVTILLFLRNGATIVLCGREFPSSLADGLALHEPTVLYASPFHFRVMTTSDMFGPGALGRVRLAVCTAASLPASGARDFHRKFGVHLSEAYGIIEVGLPFLNDSRNPEKDGSVGRALPGYELRFARADAEGIGEIQIRGPGMLDAYYAPWRPKDEILDDGWFATGDLGWADEEGFLHLSGRRKNVINFAGMKVFPEEVEAILNRCPGVVEAVVYGRPHSELGELPCADVVLEAAEATNDRAIRRFCYRHLASYKVPKEIRVVTEVAKTASGKIRRWERGGTP